MSEWEQVLFQVLSFSPGPFWLILFFRPLWPLGMKAFDVYLWLLALVFFGLTLPVVPSLIPVISNPTLSAMQAFLSTPHGTLGVWNHMILGDLWIGRWITYEGIRLGWSPWLRAPFLLATLYFGPLGLAAFLVARAVLNRRFSLWSSSFDGKNL